MNDTPETDAVLKQFEHHLPNWLASEIIAAVARKLERDRDSYKNKLISYENALIQISKLSYNDCPDFALDSIQSLTHNILND